MNLDVLKQAHSKALMAAGRLRLPLRSKVWRGQAGEFTGSNSGASMDFQDHRAYSPGDDPRHINWQAYARTGTYTMKLFSEEVRPLVDLIIDASESMFFDEQKAMRVAELFYFIAESSIATGASLTIHAVRGDISKTLDSATLRTHQWFSASRDLPASDPASPPDLSRLSLRASSIRVFLSDLLFPANPDPILRALTSRHGSAIIFSPFLESEARPTWSGNFEFIDAERKTHHPHRIEPHILKRYQESYTNHFAFWKQQAQRRQTILARIPAAEDLATVLCREAVTTGALESIR